MDSELKQYEQEDYKSDDETYEEPTETMIDGQKKCNRCKVLLPYSSFRSKANNHFYKSCISCESTRNKYRNVEPKQRFDEVVHNLRRQYAEQQLSVEQLFDKLNDAFSQINQLREALEETQRRLDNFEELDETGYVYTKQCSQKDYISTRACLIKAIRNISTTNFFTMKSAPLLSRIEFDKRTSRKAFIIALGKHLNNIYKGEYGRSSPRIKSSREVDELVEGNSSLGCRFPPTYWQHVKPYIVSKNINISYMMDEVEPDWL